MTTLELSYLALTALMVCILIYGYQYALKKTNVSSTDRTKRVLKVVLMMAAWFTYLYFLAKSDVMKTLTLPPRMPLLSIFPLFVITGLLLRNKSRNAIVQAVPVSWPIYYQSFRIIIESLFVATVAAGFLHKEVTIEGYNYDMVFAYTAPLVGLLIFKFKKLPLRFAVFWNYLGLAVITVIIFLFMSTMFLPRLYGNVVSNVPMEFLDFPYILVGGFLMPSAVFIHVFSLVQLKGKLREQAQKR